MASVAKPRSRTAVKACHGSGKTFTAAELVLWWVFTGGIALTTAPTWKQVEKVLWGEIHIAYGGARFPLGGVLNQTELKIGPHCYGLGLSTNEGVNFQGFHGNILVVLDEAPGIRPDIFDAIRGIRSTGDVRILALGNPVIAAGPFYDAFTAHRSGWNTFTISAFDTPNLAGLTVDDVLAMSDEELDDNPYTYLPSRWWVKEMYEELGPQAPLYVSRVLGGFPAQSDDSLISLAWLEAAKLDEPDDSSLVAGLDVAGPGEDETVLCIRAGARIQSIQSWHTPDPRGEVVAALRPYKDRIRVQVDTIGIGYYMAQHIKDAGFDVVEVNVSLPATDAEKYANLKAEYYWGLRERFQTLSVANLVDVRTVSQLSGIRYKHTPRGQIIIESKEDARKRGVKSPDRAEAMMLAFAVTPEAERLEISFL